MCAISQAGQILLFATSEWQFSVMATSGTVGDFQHGGLSCPRNGRARLRRTDAENSRNHRWLRTSGWRVVRLWEHQIERDPDACLKRIIAAIEGKKVQRTI